MTPATRCAWENNNFDIEINTRNNNSVKEKDPSLVYLFICSFIIMHPSVRSTNLKQSITFFKASSCMMPFSFNRTIFCRRYYNGMRVTLIAAMVYLFTIPQRHLAVNFCITFRCQLLTETFGIKF